MGRLKLELTHIELVELQTQLERNIQYNIDTS